MRLVSREENRPSSNETFSGAEPITIAAIRLPLSISATAALENTVAAWRMERPEWVPPPARTTSVSPMMMRTLSAGT